MNSDESTAQLAGRNSLAAAPLRVSEVMTSDTMTMRPHQSFAEVVWLMSNRSFHHMLVVDSDARLCGVISDRDVLRALSRSADWSKKRVSEIMTRDSITITPDASISTAIREMLEKKINCLPVVAPDGSVCGIVTSTDLLAAYGRIQAKIEESGNSTELPKFDTTAR
jgi:acetoin utilization protein AcuB